MNPTCTASSSADSRADQWNTRRLGCVCCCLSLCNLCCYNQPPGYWQLLYSQELFLLHLHEFHHLQLGCH